MELVLTLPRLPVELLVAFAVSPVNGVKPVTLLKWDKTLEVVMEAAAAEEEVEVKVKALELTFQIIRLTRARFDLLNILALNTLNQ